MAIRADGARSDIVYSAAGRIESIAHADGARSEYQYDPAGRIDRPDPLFFRPSRATPRA